MKNNGADFGGCLKVVELLLLVKGKSFSLVPELN